MAIVSAFVASCTAAGDPNFNMSAPSFTSAEAPPDASASETPTQDSSENLVMSSEGTTALPETVAYVPVVKPGSAFPDVQAPATETQSATDATSSMPQAAQAAASDAKAQSAAAAGGIEEPAEKQAVAVPADYPVYVTATDPKQAFAPQPKKRSFLSSLFGATPASAAPAPLDAAEPAQAEAKPLIAPEPEAKPLVNLASTEDEKAEVKVASLSGDDSTESLNALPGVRQSALFEIKRKSGIDDDSDVDVHEEEDYGPVRVATAGGLARLAPNGLITQTDQVDVACLKPSLVRVLKTVEQHYGRKVVVTSGYRSPAHNRRARGAKNSLHMYCAAADIQVAGIGKWELAAYFRTMPGRGGVGTYCHTESVHIDVGPERDWNWRCRRRKG